MNIQQSLALSDLKVDRRPKNFGRKRTAAEIVSRVFSRAEESGDPIMGITARQWQRDWLSSNDFMLVDLPLHLTASPIPSNDNNKVLSAMRAASDSIEPIVVDLNKKQIGRPSYGAFYPPVIVVDGQHRYRGHSILGRETIKAWVGTLAAKAMGLQAVTTIEASNDQRKNPDRVESVIYQIPGSHRSTPLAQAVEAMGGPGSSLGQGSGPSLATKPRPSPGMTLNADKPKIKGTGYFGYKKATQTQSDKTKGGSKSEMASKLQGTGYYGYQKATKVQSDKTKGGSKSEMASQLMGAGYVRKLVTDYTKACKAGACKGTVKAMAPPGMEHTVKGLKKHFPKGSASPFKLAWYLHDKKSKVHADVIPSHKEVDLGERPPKVKNPAKGV